MTSDSHELADAVRSLLVSAGIHPRVTAKILRLIADAPSYSEGFAFEIPGKPVSGNLRTVHDPKTGETHLVREARTYANRIKSIVQVATTLRRWQMPDYVAVDLELFNINMDRDNVAKSVNDPLQRVAFADDRRILDGDISRHKDAGGPRVAVFVRAVDGTTYGFGKPRAIQDAVVRGLPAHVRASIERAR